MRHAFYAVELDQIIIGDLEEKAGDEATVARFGESDRGVGAVVPHPAPDVRGAAAALAGDRLESPVDEEQLTHAVHVKSGWDTRYAAESIGVTPCVPVKGQ